jgi:hypothetical protein
MSDEPDLGQTRTLLRRFDLGPLPELDLDEVMRRGRRRRRSIAASRVAAVVAVAVVVGVGFATLHGRSESTPSPVSTVNPTPSPSTAAERVTAVMNAVNTATSVHVLAQFPQGSSLDVVVTQHGALGTLTYKGKTYTYLAVGGGVDFAVYIKGDGFDDYGMLTPAQVATMHGRWVDVTQQGGGPGPFMNLAMLSQWFYPSHGNTTTLGQTKSIDGTSTIAMVNGGMDTTPPTTYVEINAPYRPVLVQYPSDSWTFSQWNAPAPTLPAAPAPADVYNPTNPTQP